MDVTKNAARAEKSRAQQAQSANELADQKAIELCREFAREAVALARPLPVVVTLEVVTEVGLIRKRTQKTLVESEAARGWVIGHYYGYQHSYGGSRFDRLTVTTDGIPVVTLGERGESITTYSGASPYPDDWRGRVGPLETASWAGGQHVMSDGRPGVLHYGQDLCPLELALAQWLVAHGG